jgi:hypothetical protein
VTIAVPLLYEPESRLDTPTSIRSEVLGLLAGRWTERSPFAASGALADQVYRGERDTVIRQLDAALAAFDTAMKRLPLAEAGRPIEGAYVQAEAEGARQTLELTQSRLRQPGVWTAIDTLARKRAPAFAAASFADTGLAHDDMAELTREVRYALAKKDPTAVSDVTKLWSALKAAMGADVDPSDPAAGFARIEYRDGQVDQSFQLDARGIDETLANLPVGECPAASPPLDREAATRVLTAGVRSLLLR